MASFRPPDSTLLVATISRRCTKNRCSTWALSFELAGRPAAATMLAASAVGYEHRFRAACGGACLPFPNQWTWWWANHFTAPYRMIDGIFFRSAKHYLYSITGYSSFLRMPSTLCSRFSFNEPRHTAANRASRKRREAMAENTLQGVAMRNRDQGGSPSVAPRRNSRCSDVQAKGQYSLFIWPRDNCSLKSLECLGRMFTDSEVASTADVSFLHRQAA